MRALKKPNCGSVFQVDEAGHASIANQIENDEINAAIVEIDKTFCIF